MSTDMQEVKTEPQTASRVLVVEDEETDRFRLISLCRRAGLEMEFHTAVDLAEMRAALDAHVFDLVFMDYHLGFSTGQEAVEELVRHPRNGDAVIIMVTSVSRHDVVIEAMRTGVADYLVKEELSEEAIRRAVAAGFEKQMVKFAQSDQVAQLETIGEAVARFNGSAAPEMRKIMTGMLWRLRQISTGAPGGPAERRQMDLERLCLKALEIVDQGRLHLGDDAPPAPHVVPMRVQR